MIQSNNKSLDWAGDQTHTAYHAVHLGNTWTWLPYFDLYDGSDASIFFCCSQAQVCSLWPFLQPLTYLAQVWSWNTVWNGIPSDHSKAGAQRRIQWMYQDRCLRSPVTPCYAAGCIDPIDPDGDLQNIVTGAVSSEDVNIDSSAMLVQEQIKTWESL